MNVIVIVSDSLRKEYLGCYGNNWVKTPNLNRLASEGILFEEAYSEGIPTIPARTTWFTGRYTFPFRGWKPLEASDLLIAEILSLKGYDTALITDTGPMFGGGFERGFRFHEFISTKPKRSEYNSSVNIEKYFKPHPKYPAYIMESRKKELVRHLQEFLKNEKEEDYSTPRVVNAGIRWLESRSNKNDLFLWLDMFDPHEPWFPPSPYKELYSIQDYEGKDLILPFGTTDYITEEELRRIRGLYAGEVTFMDKWVGTFLERVEDLGILGETLIIFTSDHGIYLGEHGLLRKSRPWPYRQLVGVPFIMSHPEKIGKGQRIKNFVDSTDLMPTILDFLEIPFYETAEIGMKRMPPSRLAEAKLLHGKSLIPVVKNKEKIRDFSYSGMYGKAWSIRSEEWSLILWLPQRIKGINESEGKGNPQLGGKIPGKTELYNRKKDAIEEEDVSEQNPEIAEYLELELRRFVDGLR